MDGEYSSVANEKSTVERVNRRQPKHHTLEKGDVDGDHGRG